MRVDWAGAIKNDDLANIYIGGEKFTGIGYQGLMTVNTKTYVDEPTRSNDGSMTNINDYDTFIVPRCKVNFKFFNIQDYQKLCNIVTASNEFYVEYFDKQFGKFVKHKMYAEPEEMAKMFNVGTSVIGLLDYEISFIGTLNDLETFTVEYNANGGTKLKEPEEYKENQDYHKGDMVYLKETVNGEEVYRHFQAIYFDNKVSGKALTETAYWTPKSVAVYSSATAYNKGNVVYTVTKDASGKNVYSFYISVFDGSMTNKPVTDTFYWKKINLSRFALDKTYSSNKTSTRDTALGDFVYDGALPVATIYEATYFTDSFSNEYPTNQTYWSSMTYQGITVRWGQSVVIADPEDMFSKPSGKSRFVCWNTKQDGTGYKYEIGQSLNVFKNTTLYAIWE